MSDRPMRMMRRSFLTALGLAAGGLAFGAWDDDARADEPSGKVTGGKPKPSQPFANQNVPGLRPNVFVHVAPDGLVTLVCHRSEMGQGIRSSLPVLLADELGADMARVKIVQADGDKAYGDQDTDGSNSIRGFYEEMRRVAATARVMLIAAAAQKLGVPAAACVAREHAVFHGGSRRSLGFGALAEAAAKLPIPSPASVTLRPREELRHVGAVLPLIDAPDYVTGRAVFGADVRLPGMLVAVIARPPVVGGKVARFDASKALAVPGVKKVLELPAPKPPYAYQPLGGVAVLADNTWAAMRGRAQLQIEWQLGDNASYDSSAYRETLLGTVRAPGRVVRHTGDVEKALEGASKRVVAEYYVPHQPHVPMEPPAAIAVVRDDGCEVWAPTQNPQASRKEVARVLGLDESKVTAHVTFLGGAFGRKSKQDFVAEAALLAKAAGVPVRVQWTREDDVQHDYYHAVSAQRLEAALDAQGKVTAWLHRTSFPTISSTFGPSTSPSDGELQQGALDLPIAVPNVRVEAGDAKAHVRIGWLRSVCNIFHAFAESSFLDELAHARGMDPRDSLLEIYGPGRIVGTAELGVAKLPNYGQPLEKHPIDVGRLRGVIERVAMLSSWNDRKKNGRALGIAAHRSFLSYVAVVASVVRAPRSGGVRVDEVWMVVDAGTIVNMDRVRSQMEGAAIFGTTIALYGGVTAKNGAIEQSNFRDARIVRMPEAPRKIHVEVVKSDGPPGGIGEPGVPPMAPAIANAVFALSGTRVRELPIARALR